MNKIIKDQLNKVRSVKLDFDDHTTHIDIPKTEEVIPLALVEGQVYVIELEDFILNPLQNSTLASNWNSGKTPKYKRYQVEFIQKMSNMYKFNGVALDNNQPIYSENWFGWFPEEGFKVVSLLKQ